MSKHRTKKEEPAELIGCVPYPIEADWDPRYAYLAGFPLSLVYVGLRASAGGTPRPAVACYWFDPGTYREDEEKREMLYYPREESPYYVRVTFDKAAGLWETFKYRRDELVCQASGDDFDMAMVQTTLIGLKADEPESDLEEPA